MCLNNTNVKKTESRKDEPRIDSDRLNSQNKFNSLIYIEIKLTKNIYSGLNLTKKPMKLGTVSVVIYL